MNHQACTYARSTVYGLLVFVGAAVVGFVVMPLLGMRSGLFAIEAEAYAFFSLLTLKGVPYLIALGILSGLLHQRMSERPLWFWATLLGVNVFVAWLVGASIAFAILG
jgi:hypothetical protein